MVLVDIYVPVLNRIYDFYLDIHKPVEELVVEIGSLIAEREDTELHGEVKDFWLCEMSRGMILSESASLMEQGIGEGAGLLLI